MHPTTRSAAWVVAVCLTLASAPAGAQSVSELSAAGWRSLDSNPDEAAALFTQALYLHPADAALHLGAGAAAYQRGRTGEAARRLQRALDLDPTLTVASKLLGEIAYTDGDLPLAIRTYERALVHAPESGEIAGRLDRVNREMARLESAAAGVERITITVTGPGHDALVERAGAVLDSTYWRVAKLLGAFPAEPITVAFTNGTFRGGVMPGWSEHEFKGEIVIPIVGASDDSDAFDRALAHELTHAMVSRMAPRGVPAWFQEGLAQYVEVVDAELAERRLHRAGRIPWARMAHAQPTLSVDDSLAYDASLLAVRALIERIGRRSTAVLDVLADGRSVDEALAPFGFTLDDLEADVTRKVDRAAP